MYWRRDCETFYVTYCDASDPRAYGVGDYRHEVRGQEPLIYIVSDIHLHRGTLRPSEHVSGVNAMFRQIWESRMNQQHRPAVLVLLGDIFDDWAQPGIVEDEEEREVEGEVVNQVPIPKFAAQESNLLDLKGIVSLHEWFLKSVVQFRDQGVLVVYVRGNHDLSLKKEMFGRGSLFRKYGVQFGGDRLIIGEVVCEHGHRYDLMNCLRIGVCTLAEDCEKQPYPFGYFSSRLASEKSWPKLPKTPKSLKVLLGKFVVKAYRHETKVFEKLFVTADHGKRDVAKTILRNAAGTKRYRDFRGRSLIMPHPQGGTYRLRLVLVLTGLFLPRVMTEKPSSLKNLSEFTPGFSEHCPPEDTFFRNCTSVSALESLSYFASVYCPHFKLVVFGHTHATRPVLKPLKSYNAGAAGETRGCYVNSGSMNEHAVKRNSAHWLQVHCSGPSKVQLCSVGKDPTVLPVPAAAAMEPTKKRWYHGGTAKCASYGRLDFDCPGHLFATKTFRTARRLRDLAATCCPSLSLKKKWTPAKKKASRAPATK